MTSRYSKRFRFARATRSVSWSAALASAHRRDTGSIDEGFDRPTGPAGAPIACWIVTAD
jgi:hypothetical protein